MTAESPAAAIEELKDTFSVLEDWTDRYRYIIDLGRNLPPLAEDRRTDANRVLGCQSAVWLDAGAADGRINFEAASDAAIVAGLIALLFAVYNHRTPAEILATSPEFLKELDLYDHLTPSRSNGLASFVKRIHDIARRAQG